MNRLWNYEDYVNHLSHQNKVVRRWAFAAIENHFPNRYTDEVCNLIGDEVEHLACAAPRYLAMHEAVQHAPAILESFKTDHGNVPSNCAIALGNMHYEPALDLMLEYFSSVRSEETFLGILDYFGNIDNENCRSALKSTIIQTHEILILGSAVANLLYHHYPEDVTFVLDRYFDLGDRDQHHDTYLRNISWALGGSEYFRNLISLILSGYFAIKERGAYLKALSPDAGVEDLIWALKNSGPSLPKPIQKKIMQMKPISELRNTLTEDLKTWGDIWTVRMMGRIGNGEFVPNLIHVLRNSDSLDYIYSDAIRAMNALDDSADEIILAAIKNKELEDWESFPILEYLPYAEAYNLALQRWEDEKNEMDSYELFAGCLRGIGDPRGIETILVTNDKLENFR